MRHWLLPDNKKVVATEDSFTAEKEALKESVQQYFDGKQASDIDLQNAVSIKSHTGKEDSKSVKYKAGIELKKRSTEKVSTKSSVHIHDWKPVTKTDNVKSQIPVYGDVCRSCGKNVTGWADKNLLEEDCTG